MLGARRRLHLVVLGVSSPTRLVFTRGRGLRPVHAYGSAPRRRQRSSQSASAGYPDVHALLRCSRSRSTHGRARRRGQRRSRRGCRSPPGATTVSRRCTTHRRPGDLRPVLIIGACWATTSHSPPPARHASTPSRSTLTSSSSAARIPTGRSTTRGRPPMSPTAGRSSSIGPPRLGHDSARLAVLTSLPGQSSVRLESFLSPTRPWIVPRPLVHAAVSMYNYAREQSPPSYAGRSPIVRVEPLFVSQSTTLARARRQRTTRGFAPADEVLERPADYPGPATDDHPFPYLRTPLVPGFYLLDRRHARRLPVRRPKRRRSVASIGRSPTCSSWASPSCSWRRRVVQFACCSAPPGSSTRSSSPASRRLLAIAVASGSISRLGVALRRSPRRVA